MQEYTKDNLLIAALNLVLDGARWSNISLLSEASKSIGIPIGIGKLLFPYGNNELLEYYFRSIDMAMLEKYHKIVNPGLKIHDRIIQCISIRLSIIQSIGTQMNKNYSGQEVTARTISYLALPWNTALALRLLWKTVDLIWHEAGNDVATDFNYYTKRMLLAAVYGSTISYWIHDNSTNNTDTIQFLTKRIYNVLSLGKLIIRRNMVNDKQ